MILGPPGAGKGTVAPIICSKIGAPQLSTGDMLRAAVRAGTRDGSAARAVMARGELVPDAIVERIIEQRIREPDCARGFILDGFPRTLAQARGLAHVLRRCKDRVTLVISIEVPDDVLEARVCGRWMHKRSGRSYHVTHRPPRSMRMDSKGQPIPDSMRDDWTGDTLYQRADDTPERLRRRLLAYHRMTKPILRYYGQIVAQVNGNQSIRRLVSEAGSVADTYLRNGASNPLMGWIPHTQRLKLYREWKQRAERLRRERDAKKRPKPKL